MSISLEEKLLFDGLVIIVSISYATVVLWENTF